MLRPPAPLPGSEFVKPTMSVTFNGKVGPPPWTLAPMVPPAQQQLREAQACHWSSSITFGHLVSPAQHSTASL